MIEHPRCPLKKKTMQTHPRSPLCHTTLYACVAAPPVPWPVCVCARACARVRVRVCVSVCLCVCVRERESMCMFVSVVFVRVWESEREWERMREREREREREVLLTVKREWSIVSSCAGSGISGTKRRTGRNSQKETLVHEVKKKKSALNGHLGMSPSWTCNNKSLFPV